MSPDAVIAATVARARAAAPADRPFVVGLCGPQGSGKSTVACALIAGQPRAATLSLDDLYRTRAERQAMARAVHPLFATRGPPGTHDVALGQAVLAAIDRGERVALPRFDKAIDDRADPASWPVAPAGLDLLVFEGWCVGAVPQPEDTLTAPINTLERDDDPDGRWRTRANAALRDYAPLFARIDLLVLLMPPSFDTVLGWRIEQERALRATAPPGPAVMTDAGVARFIAHYERITRHVLAEMPARAGLVVALDEERRVISVERRTRST